MTRSQLVSILSAIAASATLAGTAVTPYVTEREVVAGEWAGDAGRIAVTRGEDDAGNQIPYLLYADPGGGVSPVRDPDALHRRRVWRIQPPDWYADPDAGVNVLPTNTYQLIHAEPGGTSRSVTVRPSDGWTVLRVDYTVTENRTADVTAPISAHATETLNDDGTCTITGRVMDGAGGIAWLSVRIDAVYAERVADADYRDDLTMGDYHFRDSIGDTSLGALRRWTVGLTTNRLAQNWARYPAERPVHLDGRALWFDAGRTTYAVGADNALSLYVNGTRALLVSADVSANTNGFAIIGMTAEPGGGAYTLYVPTGYVSYRVQTCVDIADAEWTDCDSTQTAGTWTYPDDYPDAGLAGTTVPAVLLTVQADPPATGRRFWRVVADDGLAPSGSALFPLPVAAPAGVLLRSPGGNWYKLKVADDGALSTEAADPPAYE